MRRRSAVAVILLAAVSSLHAQAPDGNAILRAAGVALPRGGAAAAFDAGLTGPEPVPPGAFATLIVGMGPVGNAARVRNAYAFGVLAGRSARHVPPAELAGAGVALVQMLASDHRPSRVTASRVAGYVFAAPIDGLPPPMRPAGLLEGVFNLFNSGNEAEQLAAMEAIGLLRETAAVPALIERFSRWRERERRQAGAALEALARIGDPQAADLVRSLADDPWADRDDAAGLAAAFAREKYLHDGSVKRLQEATSDRSLGPRARSYLAELGVPVP
ncbi:MAG: HEAT repeat domain-containing protein [Vicinamibacterales bacterium]